MNRPPIRMPVFTPAELFQIPWDEWNKLIDELRQNAVIRFTGGRSSKDRHAWETSLRWDAEREAWLAQTAPGFVNGLPAELGVPIAFAPEATLARLNLKPKPGEKGNVRARLTEQPEAAVTTWFPPTTVPAWFRETFELYEPPSEELTVNFDGSVSQPYPEAPPADARRLVQSGLYLTQRRPFSQIDFDDQGRAQRITAGTTERTATLSVGFPPAEVSKVAGADLIAGDGGLDTLPIATLWLLSPPGASIEDEPDATWSPFVEHHQFYNLNHDFTRPAAVEPISLPGAVPSLSGVAGGLISQLIGLIEQEDSLISALLSDPIEGRFWSV